MREIATIIDMKNEHIETMPILGGYGLKIKEFDELGRHLIIVFSEETVNEFICDIETIRKQYGSKS